MAKKDTKNGYKLQIVAAELRDKRYRKYLYPSIIDGITYEDDPEKKLSESSWFRCLTPTQQIVVEKEMRLRMAGAFNQPVLVYRDADMDAAPAIPKPILSSTTVLPWSRPMPSSAMIAPVRFLSN